MGRATDGFELFDFTDVCDCEADLTETFDVLLSEAALEEAVDFIDREDMPFDTDACDCEDCFGVIEVLLFFKETWLVLLFDVATSATER